MKLSRAAMLWSMVLIQSICCAYFLMDSTWDLLWPTSTNLLADSDTFEALITFALFLSLAFTANELRQFLTRHTELEDQIKVASGAFSEVMEARFSEWSLTNAEREIAILAIKGFSIAEMAELRDTKQGTVKAQCASLYKKADVSGRLQLISVFLDALIEDDLVSVSQKNEA